MYRSVWSRLLPVVVLAALPAMARAAPDAVVLEDAGDLPSWSIRHGGEFWRAGATKPDPIEVAQRLNRSFHAVESALLARAAGYDALLDRQGAEVRMETASLCVSTREVRAGDETIATRAAAPWVVVGDTAQRRLDGGAGVIEHLLAGEAGLEMSWILPGAPVSEGPLTIVVDVEGMRPVGEGDDGHRFAADDLVARIGRAFAVDSSGRRWPLGSTVEAGRLRVEVEEAILAEATYPLAIDPVVGPVGAVLPGSAGIEASVAAAEKANRFLVAWTDTTFGNPDIRGAIVTPTGVLVAVVPISGVTPELESNPSVASDGTNFYIAWEQAKAVGAPARIFGRGVNAAGGFLAPAFHIAGSFAWPSANAPDVTWDGTRWVVGWHEIATGVPPDIQLAYLHPLGNAILFGAAPSPSPFAEVDVALAAIGPTVVAVWTDSRPGVFDNSNIWSATLVGGAVTFGPVDVSSLVDGAFGPSAQARADIDSDAIGNAFFVSFTNRNTRDVDIMGVDLTAAGVPVGPWAIATTPNVEDYSSVSRINGPEFFIAWQDSTMNATLIDHIDVPAGVIVGAVPILTPAREPDVACLLGLISCFAVQEMMAGPAIWGAQVTP